jgi:hypothetical protein
MLQDPVQGPSLDGSGLFVSTLPLQARLTFEAASTLRKALKLASQFAGISRAEREVCLEHIDELDKLLERFATK